MNFYSYDVAKGKSMVPLIDFSGEVLIEPYEINYSINDLYLNMNALSRQYFVLDELCSNIKNRYKNLIYLYFLEYELIIKKAAIYNDIALKFIEKFPHADIISDTRIDCL